MAFSYLAACFTLRNFVSEAYLDVGYGHNEHCVLAVLSNRASEKGVCWPGCTSISQNCQLSKRAVARALVDLHKLGLITSRPPTLARKSKTYTIQMERMQEVIDFQSGEPVSPGAEPDEISPEEMSEDV